MNDQLREWTRLFARTTGHDEAETVARMGVMLEQGDTLALDWFGISRREVMERMGDTTALITELSPEKADAAWLAAFEAAITSVVAPQLEWRRVIADHTPPESST